MKHTTPLSVYLVLLVSLSCSDLSPGETNQSQRYNSANRATSYETTLANTEQQASGADDSLILKLSRRINSTFDVLDIAKELPSPRARCRWFTQYTTKHPIEDITLARTLIDQANRATNRVCFELDIILVHQVVPHYTEDFDALIYLQKRLRQSSGWRGLPPHPFEYTLMDLLLPLAEEDPTRLLSVANRQYSDIEIDRYFVKEYLRAHGPPRTTIEGVNILNILSPTPSSPQGIHEQACSLLEQAIHHSRNSIDLFFAEKYLPDNDPDLPLAERYRSLEELFIATFLETMKDKPATQITTAAHTLRSDRRTLEILTRVARTTKIQAHALRERPQPPKPISPEPGWSR